MANRGFYGVVRDGDRSEEHTSELQSHSDLVCRLLLEKKKAFLYMVYISLFTSFFNYLLWILLARTGWNKLSKRKTYGIPCLIYCLVIQTYLSESVRHT